MSLVTIFPDMELINYQSFRESQGLYTSHTENFDILYRSMIYLFIISLVVVLILCMSKTKFSQTINKKGGK